MEKESQWTPELEARHQYVEKQYDNARFLGLDVLKICLNAGLALNIVPMIFNDKIHLLFTGKGIGFIYASWICILFGVLSGFYTYCFIFEGYYFKAHQGSYRWLGGSREEIDRALKKSNWYFDWAHLSAKIALCLFTLAIALIVIPIALKILP